MTDSTAQRAAGSVGWGRAAPSAPSNVLENKGRATVAASIAAASAHLLSYRAFASGEGSHHSACP